MAGNPMTHSRKACGCSTASCGCCEGTQPLTPAAIRNRPGLDALAYRVGTHASFLATMKARIASMRVDAVASDGQSPMALRPLQKLNTRADSDPSIALLDAWAVLADVLSFYQERIANEAYLRTATERRSVLELARLVGYALRPGVSASVFLAYTLDDNQITPVEIAAGARAQSIPGPDELPQSFETSETLLARAEWSHLRARRTAPQRITESNVCTLKSVYFAGTDTGLKPNDPILFSGFKRPVLRYVESVEADFENKRSKVTLQLAREKVPVPEPVSTQAMSIGKASVPEKPVHTDALGTLRQLVVPLSLPPAMPAARSSAALERGLREALGAGSDVQAQLLAAFYPQIKHTMYSAWASGAPADASGLQVFGFGLRAGMFGGTAPLKPAGLQRDTKVMAYVEWPIADAAGIGVPPKEMSGETPEANAPSTATQALESRWMISLDAAFDQVLPDSKVVVQRKGHDEKVYDVVSVETIARADYGITGKSTQLLLKSPWRASKDGSTLAVMRGASVFAQSKALTLADEPVTSEVSGNSIELDRLYDGLQSGRWIIVSGERVDVPGVMASELVMVAGVQQAYDASLPGDTVHTTLQLANKLAYRYQRATLRIHGNVVKATHGETRLETLGSGNGAQSLQAFALKQPPLTFVSAANPGGVASTLKAWVNGVEWHEQETLALLGPRERAFVSRTGDDGVTQLIFGNGEQGARLPSGVENIRAVYRNGIGRPGNVRAGQISLLQTRPLGVKEVSNPLRASGGADRESLDLARESTPLAVMALDRLVSVQDYADFARTFAGIGKATARRLSDGRRELVHVTIAGADDIPIERDSDLYLNLLAALRKYGDPALPVGLDVRALTVLVLSARVRLAPDYAWDPVAARIRAGLLQAFGFGQRALAQPVALGQIMALVQSVEGVDYVDVDSFSGLPEPVVQTDGTPAWPSPEAIRVMTKTPAPSPWVDARPAGLDHGVVRPAQLAIFVPGVPDTLILNPMG